MSNISYPKYKLQQDISINSVTASSGFTGSFYGDGSGLTNLPPDAYTTQVSGNITGSGIVTDKIRLKDDITLNSITASVGVTSSFYGDGAGLYNIPTGAINNINQFATLTGVSGTFISGTQLTTILNDYATLSDVSGTFVSGSQLTQTLADYATLTEVSGTFISGTQLNSVLSDYATLIGVSSSFIPKDTMVASFTSSDADLPSVQANITGGTHPYTYEWSLAQGNYNSKVILPPFNSSSVVLINNFENNSYIVTDSTMLKLTVTDSNNVKNTFYHNHSVVGYSPMTLNVGRVVTASYCGDGNMLSASIPLFGVDFLDSTYMNDVYETQTKCSDTAKEENYSIQYRELRDAMTFNIREKFTIDHYNHNYTASVLDTTYQFKRPGSPDETCGIEDFNGFLNIQFNNATTYANNTVIKSYQQIRKINQLYGLEIHKNSISWNAKVLRLSKDWSSSGSINYPDLTGTIADHIQENTGIVDLGTSSSLPTEGNLGDIIQISGIKYAWSGRDSEWNSSLATRIYELDLRSVKDCIGDIKVKFIPITDLAERPTIGVAGDIYEHENIYYAWNTIDSSWDIYLGETISDIYVRTRATRDANVGSLNGFVLTLMPFINAAFNFPMHKIR